MNGRRKSRSRHVGPGGIACVCCRPASRAKSKRIASREARREANAELTAHTSDAMVVVGVDLADAPDRTVYTQCDDGRVARSLGVIRGGKGHAA